MFEMTQEQHSQRNAKELLLKIGLTAVALAALAGVIYFFAFTGVVK